MVFSESESPESATVSRKAADVDGLENRDRNGFEMLNQ